ncbi:SICAvar, type I [Plasmodium knowlesi strain H]|uniref:SICAvar, type I n=1 Tax=Plasmodium knowlesi (strain H) TaxID=5851 RepID=A0A1A7W154_PLAKH|nr:SICAvar, type I [Plasmodium knowlesi strain H]
MFEDRQDKTGLKESLDKICLPCLDNTELCKRAECVIGRWKTNRNGQSAIDPWEEVQTQLKNLSGEIQKKKDSVGSHCTDLQSEEEKEICKLIAAGLKSIYEIKANKSKVDRSTKKDLEDQLFRRTMRCVLLNAFADKLEQLPCAEEKKVKDAIDKAFEKNSDIRGGIDACKKDDDKCFTCDRFNGLANCEIGENGNKDKVKGKVEPMLEGDNTLKKQPLEKTICKPCTGEKNGDFCKELNCVAEKLGKRKYGSSSGTPSWNDMKDDFGTELKALLDEMKKNDNQNAVATKYCSTDKGGNTWSERDAHGAANKTACKLVVAGLQHISSIQESFSTKEKTPYDNQEFKQLASCLWLKEVVKKMKEESKICDISKGIQAAFLKTEQIKGEKCTKEPCIVCNWDDNNDKNKLGNCQIGNETVNVNTKLEAVLTGEKKNEVDSTLRAITETKGNADSSLCPRLQCLASRVRALKKEIDFWNEKGEVANLWTELSQAMTKDGGNGTKGNGCDKMDSEERDATGPEKKACNYLHAGLKTLYNGSTTAATTTPSTTSSSGTISLKDNPLLRQTVGCLLLHAYAKKMKETSTCVIDSGIAKAFKAWNEDNKSTCKDNGTKPCVPCEWNEDILESCHIHTTDATRTNQTAVKSKLTQVQGNIDRISNINLKDINKMSTLCDYIRCVGPKWFKNKAKTTNGNIIATKDWCNFWEEEGVRTTLQDMFQKIVLDVSNTSGANTNNATCRIFGDNNPDSVERKACNHIAAGLKYIKNIPSNVSGSGSVGAAAAAPAPAAPAPAANQNGHQHDDNFFKQSMMCAALNLYATKIKKASEEKCPIDEKKIEAMFETWNRINNSSCNAVRSASKNNCFLCSRQKEEFNNCKLSVSKTLINTTSTQTNGDCETNATKVKTKMEGLLNDSKTTKMKETLSTITNMDSFCSKMQCAAKQYHKNKHNGAQPKTTLSWDEINSVVNEELKELLEKITNHGHWKQKEFDQYCKENIGSSWSNDTGGEKTAKQKACKLFALGLKHISDIKNNNNQKDDHAVPLKQTMMCAALNLYADQLITKATDQCPLDGTKLGQAIKYAFDNNSNATRSGANSCKTGSGTNSCFFCERHENFPDCRIGSNPTDKVKDRMIDLLNNEDATNSEPKSNTPNMTKTLNKINKIESFCTQVQCAIKQYGMRNNKKKGQNGTVTWDALSNEIGKELNELLEDMNDSKKQSDAAKYCNDNNPPWYKLGHKERKTNKAACLHFAAGLQHVYTHGIAQRKGHVKGQFNGPSLEQTMGCLFLKEYAKQLKEMANKKKQGHSWVHPLCDIDKGITHAFSKSEKIMEESPQCKDTNDPNSCFECTLKDDYINCSIGQDSVKDKVESMFKDDSMKQEQMEKTLENTVCPILLTDLLTPFLPLAPVSIGLSAMAYYLWKYFGQLGKIRRFRRAPLRIPGSSVQEQVLDHVQQEAGPHEYRLVKERKLRSAPTRTKRSGRVNRRTIIEIHFEVLDECQKGDTQLNQKDFLELLVREFMGSEFMEEEQVPKEEVLMEGVPLERVPMESVPMECVPMERVPNLGSGFMV